MINVHYSWYYIFSNLLSQIFIHYKYSCDFEDGHNGSKIKLDEHNGTQTEIESLLSNYEEESEEFQNENKM